MTPQAATLVPQTAQPVALSETAALLSMIERAARDDTVNIDKMRELLAMRKEIIADENERSFNEAMARAQAEMRPVTQDAHNSQTKSKYATAYALDKMVRPIYTKHGFALSYNTELGAPPGEIRVVCYVTCAGHTRKYQVDMPADGKGAKGGDVMTRTHATGSAMTYGERYLLKAIFNLQVGGDDDGNAAGGVSAGDTSAITGEQVAELKNAFETLGANEAAFCTVFKIATIEELPAREFATAKARLARWAQQKGKAK
jgi:hypothetical protein